LFAIAPQLQPPGFNLISKGDGHIDGAYRVTFLLAGAGHPGCRQTHIGIQQATNTGGHVCRRGF